MTFICDSITGFKTRALSSKGDQYYDLEYTATGAWTCTCPAFKYRGGNCKHIENAMQEVCRWEGPEDALDDGACPQCGSDVKEI